MVVDRCGRAVQTFMTLNREERIGIYRMIGTAMFIVLTLGIEHLSNLRKYYIL